MSNNAVNYKSKEFQINASKTVIIRMYEYIGKGLYKTHMNNERNNINV